MRLSHVVQAVIKEYPRPKRGANDVNKGRCAHSAAQDLQFALAELREERLEEWKWGEFVGEHNGLDLVYAETDPNCSAKVCVTKVINQVLKMLQTSAKGAAPRGEEAQRVIVAFTASLKNPTLVSEVAWREDGCTSSRRTLWGPRRRYNPRISLPACCRRPPLPSMTC
jgi:hypothetical protein